MAGKEKLNFAQKTCVSSAGKLMQQTGMLSPGARIGVAVSGGADSWVLLKTLAIRQGITPFHVELMALHINPGFDPDNHAPLRKWLDTAGIAAHVEKTDHGPRGHSSENKTNSPCFYCCKLRRKRLFELADHYGLTHLALGHNADDLTSNFFMNLTLAGRVEGMSMRESFFESRLQVIRPLLWVEKAVIRKACAAWGLPVWKNPCPSSETSARKTTMQRISAYWGGDIRMKRNIMNALRRWQLDSTLKTK